MTKANTTQSTNLAKVVVAKSALRDLLREVMWNKDFSGWSSNSGGPTTVNPNVDPSIAVTDPINPNFKPQNKVEFGIAVDQLVKNLPDTEVPELFDAVKTAIEDDKDEEDEATMKTKAAQGGTEQVEEAVRRAIRNIIAEINPRRRRVNEAPGDQHIDPETGEVTREPAAAAPARGKKGPTPVDPSDPRAAPGHTDDQGNYVPVNKVRLGKNQKPGPVVGDLPPVRRFAPGVSGGESDRRTKKNIADLQRGSAGKHGTGGAWSVDKVLNAYENPKVDPADAPESGAGPAQKRAYKSTAIGNMADVQGATFEQIAQELGFAVSGAKQAVDKALKKARFVSSLSDDSLEGDIGEGDDLEVMTLMAMNDYIKMLARGAENPSVDPETGQPEEPLTAADIKLMKDHPDIVRELDGFREFLHSYIRKAMKSGDYGFWDEDDRPASPVEKEEATQAVAAAGGGTTPSAPTPRPAAAAPAVRGKKDTYKIYPGAKAYGAKDPTTGERSGKPPAVTRVGAKVYRSGADTQFKPGESGRVAVGDNGKLRVSKVDGDHTQEWDPVEEGKRPVLYLRPGNRS